MTKVKEAASPFQYFGIELYPLSSNCELKSVIGIEEN